MLLDNQDNQSMPRYVSIYSAYTLLSIEEDKLKGPTMHTQAAKHMQYLKDPQVATKVCLPN